MENLSKVATPELHRRRASTTRRLDRYRAMGNEALERIVLDERWALDAEITRRRKAGTRTARIWATEAAAEEATEGGAPGREKLDDDGREYGHPGDRLRGWE